MIEKKTEKQYRAIDIDSYSSLATFAKDRRQYHKKYFVGEPIDEDDDSKSILMGTLVETLLLEGQEEFDNKFYMSLTDKDPTPSVMNFINALYKITVSNTDQNGVILEDFLDLAKQAYDEAGIKKPGFIVFMNGNEKSQGFIGSQDELYYKQLRESKPMCKKIVSVQDIDNAYKIEKELRTNYITADIINQRTNDSCTVYNQHQIEEYEIDGLPLKSMYDKLIAYHTSKKIQFYDLKCTFAVERFYEEYYLKRFSYIQGLLYYRALLEGKVDLGFEYSDYEILPPKFIVCDSFNLMSPLIYSLNQEDLNEAYNGFYHKNRYYPGVRDIIKDVIWAKENNEWRISRENFLKGGIVEFKKVR